MHRRRFLRDGASALSVAAFIDSFLFQNDANASTPPSIGPEQPFDYARLKGIARARAATAYAPPSDELPPRIAKLSWDEWQSIRFRPERALWVGEDLPFVARFFHLGFR